MRESGARVHIPGNVYTAWRARLGEQAASAASLTWYLSPSGHRIVVSGTPGAAFEIRMFRAAEEEEMIPAVRVELF